MDDQLIETLRDAQRFGFFGDRPIEEAASHSIAFVDAIGSVAAGTRLVDLGSGGGLPGLVLADHYRHVALTLVDRRQKRTDFLRRAIRRLEFDHVEIVTADVADLCRRVARGTIAPFDVATARGFGPPSVTLRYAVELVHESGRVVISEPPSGDRWDADVVADLGVERLALGAVSVFRRRPIE